MKIELLDYSKLFLDHSWNWLNDPEIKRLTNTPDFSREDQLKWFEKLNSMSDYKIWGISIEGIPAGACGLKNITKLDCEYYGYIGEKSFWGKGYGSIILSILETKAKEMGMNSIWLKVLKLNVRAVKLYEKHNYKIESEENGLLIMRKYL